MGSEVWLLNYFSFPSENTCPSFSATNRGIFHRCCCLRCSDNCCRRALSSGNCFAAENAAWVVFMQTGQNMISSTRKHPETQTIQCHTTTLLHAISRKKQRAKIIQNLKGEVFKRLVMRRQRGWLQQHIQPNQFRLQHHDHLRHASRSFLQVSGIYLQVLAMHLPLIFAGLLDTLKKPGPTMVKGEPQRDSIHLDHAFLHQQVF